MSHEEKAKSHVRIVANASRLLRERGLEGASVQDLMKAAGMTHGGFYKHFDSKDTLVELALENAFSEFVSALEGSQSKKVLADYRHKYLSPEHLTHPGRGCPVAALGTEIARASVSLKAAFGAGIRRTINAISACLQGSAASRRTDALREFSMLVGAIVIARAGDPELANEVLVACSGRQTAGVR